MLSKESAIIFIGELDSDIARTVLRIRTTSNKKSTSAIKLSKKIDRINAAPKRDLGSVSPIKKVSNRNPVNPQASVIKEQRTISKSSRHE